mgnify:CR=1 FL=1
MIFSTERYGGNKKSETARNETLFTVANGNLGLRGDTEEKCGTLHKGTYINGFYDSEPILYGESAFAYAKNHETILNLPDPKRIELFVNGIAFGLEGEGTVKSHRLELDMDEGVLRRKTEWKKDNSELRLETLRLASFENQDCALIVYKVLNTGSTPISLKLSSYIDTSVGNILAEEDPRIGAKFRHKPLVLDSVNSAENFSLSFFAHTARSGLFLSGTVLHKVNFAKNAQNSFGYENELPCCTFDFSLEPNESFTLEKYIAYCSSKTADGLAKKSSDVCSAFASDGLEKILTAQKNFLTKFWSTASIFIKSDDRSQEALRFNLFHLLQSSGRNGSVSIAAKGLTSEGYEGHFFWDSESYVCPVFTYTAPEVAKKLLEYRASILPLARERAKEMNLKGALYPWRTISGNETSAYFPAGTAQYHINADILFAVERYQNAHGDFDSDALKKMSSESARMYASLGSFVPHKGGAFCINDVTGPDEYTAIVNNNAFTNLMVREAFEIAVKRSENESTNAEKLEWKKMASAMYIPFDKEEGVYPQDDSFMDKAEWDFAATPKENYPLLLHYHPLVIYRHRVLKQPDLVLAQFLLSSRFTRAEKIRNFAFYEKYTTGDSSLSHCIMCIMAAESGDIEKAYNYYTKTVRMDIDDVNGNSRDGIHTACMAGSWMAIVYGFAGFHDYNGDYSFEPRLPKAWENLSFSLSLKSCILDISLTHQTATYKLREGKSILLKHRNESFSLSNGESKTFDLKPKLKAVLFDLDGVITNTAPLHYKAWKELSDSEGLTFNEKMNEKLLGISREESLKVILKENNQVWSEEKIANACKIKNERYKELLKTLSPKDILPGIKELLEDLQKNNIASCLASSSKNAPAILDALSLTPYFVGIADASRVQKAKPAPDIFLDAAEKSGAWYTDCVGIEDAEAGIKAINSAGIHSLGIRSDGSLTEADLQVKSTADINLNVLQKLFGGE